MMIVTRLFFKFTVTAALAATAVASVSGCGRADTVYVDPVTGVVGTDGRTFLPTGFADQSVNNASVEITAVGDHKELRFRLLGGAAAPGAFNDANAVGNRAILGIGKYDKTLLSAFRVSVSFTTTTSSVLQTSLLIDLKCDASLPIRTFVSDAVTSSASVADAIWSVDGAAITDSMNNTLVPSSSGTARASLNALLTNFPNACLRAAVSDAAALPKQLQLGSVLLTVGDQNSTTAQELTVSDLKVNGDDYKTWGQK